MFSSGAAVKEPVKLLSIDGGGIRGLSALVLLEQLMDASNEHRRKMNLAALEPWETFDMIGGTSTGGLIAIMLGRLRMSISDCKKAYSKFSEKAFTSKNLIAQTKEKLSVGPRFKTAPLEDAIKSLIGKDWETLLLKDDDSSSCKVFVVAHVLDVDQPAILRSYRNFRYPSASLQVMHVWEACRATSAALTFFEPIVVDGTTYSDGALLYNNPVQLVHGEASEMFEGRDQVIISLGTGIGNPDKFDPKLQNVAQLLGKLATETERTANDFYRREDAKSAKSERYFRFSVPSMGDIGMHEHEKLNVVKLLTEGYLGSAEVSQKAEMCARVLARVPTQSHFNQARSSHQEPSWVVPFGQNKEFVGRKSELTQLLETVPPSKEKKTCQHTAITGLGGIGKTQVAVEVAFQIRDQHPDCSIFWVPAMDAITFENGYRKIGQCLGLQGVEDEEADFKLLVKTALSDSTWHWLLIIDNADDEKLIFEGPMPLLSFLPSNFRGSVLFTTRTDHVAVRLDTPNVISLNKMNKPESIELLLKRLPPQTSSDTESLYTLLEYLANLPLAIRQASAYMAKTKITAGQYLHHCQSSDKGLIELLSKDFEDRGRYGHAKNAIATTWLISFRQISRDSPLAIKYLAYMSFLSEKDIPMSILPAVASELDAYEAVGTLQAYGFITKQDSTDNIYSVHRLVHLATRNWLEKQGKLKECVTSTLAWQLKLFPHPEPKNKSVWIKYLPHTARTLEFRKYSSDKHAAVSLLIKMSGCYKTLGLYQSAARALEQAFYLEVETVNSPEVRALLNAHMEATKKNPRKEFVSLGQLVVDTLSKPIATRRPLTPGSMAIVARSYLAQGKLQEAMAQHQESLELAGETFGLKDTATLRIMTEFATALSTYGYHEQAEVIHRQTLALQNEIVGQEHPDSLRSLYYLAVALLENEKYREADSMLHDALDLHKQVLGEEDPSTLLCMGKLGLLLFKQERFEETEALLGKTVELQKQVLGDKHPDLLTNLMCLALALRRLQKYEEAENTKQLVDRLRDELDGEMRSNI